MRAMKRVAPLGQMKVRKIESDNNGDGGHVETKAMEKNRRGMCESPKRERGKVTIKYRECRRNYAASIGHHANDGCREFVPGGMEGTREAVRCGACGCHRNFHRKEQPRGSAAADYRRRPPPPPTYLHNAVRSIPSSSSGREKNSVGGGFPPPLPPRSLPLPPLPPAAPVTAPAFHQQQEQCDKQKYKRRSETVEMEAGTGKNKRFRTKS